MTKPLPPDPGSVRDAEFAVANAAWWMRMALDLFGTDSRKYHPAVYGRVLTAEATLRPAVELSRRENDQRVVSE